VFASQNYGSWYAFATNFSTVLMLNNICACFAMFFWVSFNVRVFQRLTDVMHPLSFWPVNALLAISGEKLVKAALLQRPAAGGSGSSGSTPAVRGRKKDREAEVTTDRDKPFSCECKSSFTL